MQKTAIYWIRRDFRLTDNAALRAACAFGDAVIPVFICDETVSAMGAAPKWRLGLGAEAFAQTLQQAGSGLVCRQGPALEVLKDLIRETGAQAVFWNRLYDRAAIARDTAVKTELGQSGVLAESHAGHVLREPWQVQTGQGGAFKVYSPFWRALSKCDIETPLNAPAAIPAPQEWPRSDAISDWKLNSAMNRGARVVQPHLAIGEAAAHARLAQFLDRAVDGYKADRDFFFPPTTSGLSENLTNGEISPRQIWQAGTRALHSGAKGAEHFLKELAWRDFAHHLHFFAPELEQKNWRAGWEGFPWNTDPQDPKVIAWQRGQTGIEIVDAAMRELYVTGIMHNRARMIVASYLTKHLLMDWRLGLNWFAECLVDWDPASNAMGWQWVAGCGPDAAPFFRVFNPDVQAEKFDPQRRYRLHWLDGEGAAQFAQAAPRSWHVQLDAKRPAPIVELKAGRAAALAAYDRIKSSGNQGQ